MPRAVDRYRFKFDDPNKSGTDFDIASLVKGEAERLAAAIQAAREAFMEGLVQALRELLDIDIGDREGFLWSLVALLSPIFRRFGAIDAADIYGQIRSGILGQIDASAVGDNRANLLDAPNFNYPGAFEGGGVWLFDADRGYMALGAVTVTVRGGFAQELTSNMAQISEAQTVRATVRVNTNAPAGDLILAGVLLLDNEVIDVPEFDRYTVGDVRDTMTGVDGLEYMLLGGKLPVPAGVNQVRLQLQIADTVPDGARVTFDQAFMGKQGGILKRHVPDLTDLFDTLGGRVDAIIDDVRDWHMDVPLVDRITRELPNLNIPILDEIKVPRLPDLYNLLGGRTGAVIGDVASWHDVVPLVDRTTRELPQLNIPLLDEVKVPRLTDLVDLFGNGAGGGGLVQDSPIEAFEGFSRQVFDGLMAAQIQASEAMAAVRGLQTSGTASGIQFGAFPDGPIPAEVFTPTIYWGAGTPAIVGGIAEWQRSGFASGEMNYLYAGPVLNYDPFEVSITMPRRSDLGADSYLMLIARASDDGLDRVVMFCGVDTIRVGVYVANTLTWLGLSTVWHVDPGATLRLQGGITAPRDFQCSVNMNVVGTYHDPAGISPMDAAHRRTGWGMRAGAGVTGQVRPGGIGSFTQNDVLSVPALGVGDYRAAP